MSESVTERRLTVSSHLLNVGGVCLQGGAAFRGGEPLLIGAVKMMVMMVTMRKAGAVSVTGG